MMLKARDEDGSQMSDQQLRDEVMTCRRARRLPGAGVDLYLLEVTRGREEVLRRTDEVIGDREPTFEDLPRLKYAAQMAKER
jgi:pentalenene oxygenase